MGGSTDVSSFFTPILTNAVRTSTTMTKLETTFDKPTTTIDPCQSDAPSLAPTLETHEGNAENIDSTGKRVDDYKDNMGRSNGVLMSPDMYVAEPDDLGDLPPPPMMLLSPS